MAMKKQTSISDHATDAAWRNLVELAGDLAATRGSLKSRIATERRTDKKLDGRSLRRTGRTVQQNVRLRLETTAEIKNIAEAQGWLVGEVIEQAIEALKVQLQKQSDTA